jgi:MSHA biogenesis protein MshK
MAETLIRPRPLLLALLLAFAQVAPHAQALQDPTRPATAPVAGGEGGEASAGPQLQSVLIASGPDGRHIAVIDGDTVRQGEIYKGARVARISPRAVELVRGKDRQVLRLLSLEETNPAVRSASRLK